jgi:hypothetical protein
VSPWIVFCPECGSPAGKPCEEPRGTIQPHAHDRRVERADIVCFLREEAKRYPNNDAADMIGYSARYGLNAAADKLVSGETDHMSAGHG